MSLTTTTFLFFCEKQAKWQVSKLGAFGCTKEALMNEVQENLMIVFSSKSSIEYYKQSNFIMMNFYTVSVIVIAVAEMHHALTSRGYVAQKQIINSEKRLDVLSGKTLVGNNNNNKHDKYQQVQHKNDIDNIFKNKRFLRKNKNKLTQMADLIGSTEVTSFKPFEWWKILLVMCVCPLILGLIIAILFSKICGSRVAATDQLDPKLDLDPTTYVLDTRDEKDFPTDRILPGTCGENNITESKRCKKISSEIEPLPATNEETTITPKPTGYVLEESKQMKTSCSETDNSSSTMISDVIITKNNECVFDYNSLGENEVMGIYHSCEDSLPPKIDSSTSTLVAEIGDYYYQ